MIYSVVLLDGKELHCLSLDDVKSLFINRQINQESLCCSAENPQWLLLKRVFDVNEWIAEQYEIQGRQTEQKVYQPQINPFDQTFDHQKQNDSEAQTLNHQTNSQFVTFNQFPPAESHRNNYNNSQKASNSNSQSNQSETYYQAETTQTNYNFENKQADFAPSKYSNQTNYFNHQTSLPPTSVGRKGLKQAGIFLLVNAFINLISVVLGSSFASLTNENQAYQSGYAAGAFLPLIIDLILAIKLMKLDDAESARKWVLARSYFGFFIFGLVIPFTSFANGNIFIGLFSLISTLFYFLSLVIVLHGEKSPESPRLVMSGISFAIYGVIIFAAISLSAIGSALPKIAKLGDLKNSQIEKYKIEGSDFQDKTTGAKVVLPTGWSMIKLDNPYINSTEARMIAVDQTGNRITMLEVVPVPGNLDMKRRNTGVILDEIANIVVQTLRDEQKKKGGFSQNSFNETARLSIFVGSHQAKLLVIDKVENGFKSKGQMIITNDELTFYVLHSWCPTEEYETAQEDFKFFEKNFYVPEKINSTFTQTAENQKK